MRELTPFLSALEKTYLGHYYSVRVVIEPTILNAFKTVTIELYETTGTRAHKIVTASAKGKITSDIEKEAVMNAARIELMHQTLKYFINETVSI